MKFVRWSSFILAFVLAAVAASSGLARGANAQNVRLLMNWFIQADQAGFWQAQIDGLGAARGIAITVIQGGPKIQTIPQVASGQAEFGVANADDLLQARLHGVPVKAVFAYLDYAPYILEYHPDPKIKSLVDLKDDTFAVSLGFAYWEWLKDHYHLTTVHEIPVTGDLTMFRLQPTLAQQGYSLYLPARMDEAGIPNSYLSVAALGYRPYSVLFTTDDMIAKHPALVRDVVATVKQGWQNYLADPSKFSAMALGMNSQISPAVNESAYKILGDGSLIPRNHARIGCMSDARWAELTKQLQAVNLLPATFDPKQAYTLAMVPGC
jgi:NitT/TauT family transport system substrate-binding protein